MNVLVAGFAPWDGLSSNPSGELAEDFGGVVLPVHWTRADRILERAIRKRRPEGLLLLGLAEGRRRLSLERFALNLDYSSLQAWRRDRRIETGAAWLREGRLPWTPILRAWARAGIPAERSHHAGTFLCNHVYFRALGRFRGPCGFLHLPPLSRVGKLRQREAVRILLRLLGRGPAARR
jgi:pyroglutamyl-peptidase